MSGVGRYIQFALVAALGAGVFAGLSQFIWSFVPEPRPVSEVDCQATVMMLSLDKSFSMVEDGSPSLRLVGDAVQQFVAKAQEDECFTSKQFGLVTFNQEASLDVVPGRNLADFDTVIAALAPKLGDSTIIEAGVSKAVETLEQPTFADQKKVLFLLTDAENYGSDAAGLQVSLERALAADVDVRAVITNEGPHVDTLRTVLGTEKVQKTDESGMGSSFFAQAQEIILSNPVISRDRALPPLFNYLFTGSFTGLVTAGIALSLLIFLNRYNKRKRILSAREFLTVLLSLVLGFVVGALTQYLFELDAIEKSLTLDGNFFQKHLIDFLIWSVIGLLLAGSLAVFRVLPNLKILNALIYGLIGGLLAGILYSLSLELLADTASGFLPALIGALVLGIAIGLSLNFLQETSVQFPIWLRVYYTSDRVYRYHPIGSAPTTVGSSSDCDVYVHTDHDRLWQFWIDGTKVIVKNFVSGTERALGFKEVVERGAIELRGMVLKIVDDKGPEKGKISA